MIHINLDDSESEPQEVILHTLDIFTDGREVRQSHELYDYQVDSFILFALIEGVRLDGEGHKFLWKKTTMDGILIRKSPEWFDEPLDLPAPADKGVNA